MKGCDHIKSQWKKIIWVVITVLISGILVAFYFYKTKTKMIDMSDSYPRVKQELYLPTKTGNLPLLVLKEAAYQEGFSHYQKFGKKKGPSYPKELLQRVIDPADETELKKVYDKMYEKGYKDAQKPSHTE